jgi:glycosyltransferase involved in cell wall biosynthesis
MRVGIDVHAAEQDGSGNCTYIRGLIGGLLAADPTGDYFLYAVDPNHPFYAGLPRRPGIRIVRTGARSALWRIPVQLAAASIRDRLDVLHVQYIAPPVHRGRLVATIHDLGFLRIPETFSKFFVRRSQILVRRTARRADRIIVGSEFSRQDIIETYDLPPDRVAVLPYGVADAFFLPGDRAADLRRAAAYGLRAPYVVYVGRMNPRKNLAALARAFTRFKASGSRPHQLVIVGKKDFETDRMTAEIRATAESGIVFTGFVPDDDLPAIVRGAEIFVYPSLFEGVGLPVMEAMAAGTPVITSVSTSLPEIAGGAARLVDPTDENELAGALAALADDPALCRRMREEGRVRARDFSWKAAARKTLEIYDGVLSGRERTPHSSRS